VVAGEVKALAAQTAKATEEISQQISGLRGATSAAVIAVGEIGHTLDEVAQVAVSVAAAIEEQNAATKEIARNVAESGAAVQEVTTRIAEVSGEAKTTGDQAVQLRTTSGKLAGDIAVLRSALVRTVRTATVEADRRKEARVSADEPCTLTFGSDGTRVAATLCDLSHGGAAIRLADGSRASDQHGTVVLDPARRCTHALRRPRDRSTGPPACRIRRAGTGIRASAAIVAGHAARGPARLAIAVPVAPG
jgi:aerotaxis receptor